ncbi:MAG: hypothetical protein HY851_09415 [candidate division Zixibacteria bacterium]|nr:hypothetical protein [candidate division Zixibacteria bacterium]
MTKIRGVIHVHTDLSHDGLHTPQELRQLFVRHNLQFVCLTDHSQDVREDQFDRLREQCRELSGPQFVLIPGLEYSCDGGVHIMGIGISRMTQATAHAEVINHIHAHGGLAVLAHPTKAPYPLDNEWLGLLDGVEIWNRAVDSKYLPQVRSIRMYFDLKKAHPHLTAFFGLDLHTERAFQDHAMEIDSERCDAETIVAALKSGRYRCVSRFFKVGAYPVMSRGKFATIAFLRMTLNGLRWVKELFQRV